jgi:two-component system, NtrC family, response regulator AtoC
VNILIVDDELGLRHTLTLILEAEGHEIRAAADGEQALASLAERDADLVLCDVRMPRMDGIGFLERYRRESGRALVIMMSAYGDDDAALNAMKRGAYDFIQKPFRADQVILVLNKAIEREGLRKQVEQLNARLAALLAPRAVIGTSAALQHSIALARKVARHPTPVLVTGESGTGKELVAQLIHAESPRMRGPLVTVQCVGLPETLMEAELFGSEGRGGALDAANDGTLLLDDVGSLPMPLQVRLARALQGLATPGGSARGADDAMTRRPDVRVIATAARDLEPEVREGRFHSDLYYRLGVVQVHLPPLRDRPEDIPHLVKHFMAELNSRLLLKVTSVSPSAMRLLTEYPWPGNVRELENVVERAMVLADGPVVDVEHLPAGVRSPGAEISIAAGGSSDLSVKRRLAALERSLIERALAQTGGNRSRAARLLELSPRALLYKIKEYGIE